MTDDGLHLPGSDQPFGAYLQQALAVAKRRGMVRLLLLTPAPLALGAWLWLEEGGEMYALKLGIIFGYVVLGVAWVRQLMGRTRQIRALTGYQGAEPDTWLPSPSHGVVFATPTEVVVGGLPAMPFDRSRKVSIYSVEYHEPSHQLIVTRYERVEQEEGEDRIDAKQERVKLSPSVGAGEAHAFAREIERRAPA